LNISNTGIRHQSSVKVIESNFELSKSSSPNSTELEDGLPNSTEDNVRNWNTHSGARARSQKSSLDEFPNFSTPPSSSEDEYPDSTFPKSTNNERIDANVRSVPDRHIAAQRVEERLSSLQLMTNRDDQPLPVTGHLEEFDNEEVMTMEEDPNQPSQPTSTEELRHGTTIRHRRVNKVSTGDVQGEVSTSSLLDTSIRELAEHLRGPLLNLSFRELAGFPKSSLPDAGIQELAEHPHQLNSPEFLNSGASNDLRRLAVEMNRQQERKEQRPAVRRSDLSSGFYPVRDSFKQDRPQNIRSSFEQDGQQSNAYGAYSNDTSNTQQDAMEISEVYYPARLEEEYYPVEEERRQAKRRSMVHFCESTIPGCTAVRSNSGNRQNVTSVKKISSQRTPEEQTAELFEPVSSVYHMA